MYSWVAGESCLMWMLSTVQGEKEVGDRIV